jgi:type I restriction enzyme S subunit
MRSSYKKLGSYIRQVDERNKQGVEENLLGVSTQKVFIESIANTVGTNFRKYKIVKRKQFTYVPDTSRRGDKIGLAMLDHLDEAIVSQAYTVFEIIDNEELDPEYLMMWFRRPEFDRYARYKSHGSVREIFGWDEMCDVELPIPSIEKQREIVAEYNTIVNRIKLNEQMNQKLEETAQAIYKHWFVDFEFPISAEYAASVGKPELEGKPYKSSGGEMVFCEELDQEIPAIWQVIQINSICEITSSKRIFQNEYVDKGVPFFRGKEIIMKKKGHHIKDPLYISEERYLEITKKYGQPELNDILISAVGTIGVSYLVQKERFYFKDGNLIWLRNFKDLYENFYLYSYMQSKEFERYIKEITIGSTQSAITIATLGEIKMLRPQQANLKAFYNIYQSIMHRMVQNKSIIYAMQNLKGILFTKMSKSELLELAA